MLYVSGRERKRGQSVAEINPKPRSGDLGREGREAENPAWKENPPPPHHNSKINKSHEEPLD